MREIDPSLCTHEWVYGGIVWKREYNTRTHYEEIAYYDLYFCNKCLTFRTVSLNERYSADLEPKANTRPYYYQ